MLPYTIMALLALPGPAAPPSTRTAAQDLLLACSKEGGRRGSLCSGGMVGGSTSELHICTTTALQVGGRLGRAGR